MLPLPVMLVCGAFGGSRDRIKFTMLWFAIMTVVFGIYAQVRIQPHDSVKGEKIILPLPGGYDVTYNLVNEVDRQFAYGQGKENVMARNLPYFLEHPAEDFEFVRVFSGVLLMRGAPGDTLIAAKWAGTVLLGGLAALAYFCWRWRKDRALFPLLFALLCLGAYTPVTGVLVAMGRIWAGHSYTALNVRYHAHHPQIIIALTCAAAFILRHRAKQRAVSSDTTETSRSIGNDTSAIACSWVCAGALFTILGMGWLYGTNMMDAWRGARLRNAAAQMFSQVLPKHSWFASWVSGTFEKTHDMSAALEQHGLLLTPLLHDTVIHQGRLGHLYVSPTTLTQNRAFGNRLWKENNDWLCEGYASLPLSDRPADAILFAYRVPGAEWTVWGFTQGDGPPHYLPGAMGKDLWGILPRDHQWPAAFMNGWHQNLSVISEPPPGAQISVWAVDMYRRQLMRIVRKRKDSPDMDGEILETLSTRRVPVDEKKSEEEE